MSAREHLESFLKAKTTIVTSGYEPEFVEPGTGYIKLTQGQKVQVDAWTLTPGEKQNAYRWYVYGSSKKDFGPMPVAILQTLQE